MVDGQLGSNSLGRKTPKPRICPGECGPEVPIEEVDSTTLNAMLLVGCQNCSQATEVKSDSRYFRFVIAKHSPERVLETAVNPAIALLENH